MATTSKKEATTTKKAAPPPAGKRTESAPAVIQVNPAGGGQMSTKESGDAASASPEQVARRAYELWQERGGDHGDDQADWHRAETELSGRDQS